MKRSWAIDTAEVMHEIEFLPRNLVIEYVMLIHFTSTFLKDQCVSGLG